LPFDIVTCLGYRFHSGNRVIAHLFKLRSSRRPSMALNHSRSSPFSHTCAKIAIVQETNQLTSQVMWIIGLGRDTTM
jgi:hypothetical protein